MVFFIHIYLSFFQSNLELPKVLMAVLQSCLSVSLNIWRLVIRPSHPPVSHVWKINRPCFPTSEFLLENSRYFSCWLDIGLIVSCWIEKACMVDLFGLLHIIAPQNSFHDQSWVKACKSNQSLTSVNRKIKDLPNSPAKTHHEELLMSLFSQDRIQLIEDLLHWLIIDLPNEGTNLRQISWIIIVKLRNQLRKVNVVTHCSKGIGDTLMSP